VFGVHPDEPFFKKALSHIAVAPFFFVVPIPINFRFSEIGAILAAIIKENLKQGWYNPGS